MSGLPVEFYLILGVGVAAMALSAWFLGDEDKRVRNLSRVGLVLGGTTVFVSTLYYVALFAAVIVAALLICIPIAMISGWFGDFFS